MQPVRQIRSGTGLKFYRVDPVKSIWKHHSRQGHLKAGIGETIARNRQHPISDRYSGGLRESQGDILVVNQVR